MKKFLLFVLAHGRHEAQHLGDRLHRKALNRISGLELLSIEGADGNAQLVALYRGQRRNVIGHFPLAQ
jgi:hypothetical protein